MEFMLSKTKPKYGFGSLLFPASPPESLSLVLSVFLSIGPVSRQLLAGLTGRVRADEGARQRVGR